MTNMIYKDPVISEILINAQQNERKIYMIEEFNRESTFKVIRALDKITSIDIENGISPKNSEPIWLVIDSYGGCLHSCFNLASVIRKYKKAGWVINTVGMRAMSAGFYILMMGSNRYAYELGSFMVHDQRAFEYGYKTVRDKRVELKEWEKEWARLKSLIFEYTDITDEEIEWYVERGLDWNMDANEMILKGVIDYVDEIL